MSKRSDMLSLLDTLEEEYTDGEDISSLAFNVMYLPVCADAMVAFYPKQRGQADESCFLLEDETFVELEPQEFFEQLREQIKNASTKQVNDYYKWWEAGMHV